MPAPPLMSAGRKRPGHGLKPRPRAAAIYGAISLNRGQGSFLLTTPLDYMAQKLYSPPFFKVVGSSRAGLAAPEKAASRWPRNKSDILAKRLYR